MNDNSPPLITGNSEVIISARPKPKNTNVINRLWTLVMEKVTDVIDYVMSENIDSDRCDGCDGKIKKSPELENSVESKIDCNTKNKKDLEKKEISDKVLKMPSYAERYTTRAQCPLGQPSHEQVQNHTEQEIESTLFAITVAILFG